ncbi:aldehyde dehydrogenase family protein [Actinophytocola oryzae]|uniref:Aldehyde dehydrogenase family protein n=1 Tax=Actinophytocola oryzae TaxID=502181 RepID=A0A4R7VRB7_9PSEU|nr:aldehyde dehydrogenase family protein [Actinophytocola oryzae]
MTLSLRSRRDEVGLRDGLLLVGGKWRPSAYTTDGRRAFRLARRLRAGTVGINGFQIEPHLPFGGFKESGLGREGGQSAFEAYTELKTVLMPLGDELM